MHGVSLYLLVSDSDIFGFDDSIKMPLLTLFRSFAALVCLR